MNKIDLITILYFAILLVISIALIKKPRLGLYKISRLFKRKNKNKKDDFIEMNFRPLALGKLLIYSDFVYQVPQKFSINNTIYYNYRNDSFINTDGLLVCELNEKGKITNWKRLSKKTFFVAVEKYKNTRESFNKEIIPIHTYEINGKKFKYQNNKDKTVLISNVFDDDDLNLLRKNIDILNYEIIPIKSGLKVNNGVFIKKYNGIKLKPKFSDKDEPFVDTSESEYYYKNKKTSREDAIAIIEMSDNPDDLNDLSFKKDKSLSEFIFKKYPSLNPKHKLT